MWKTEASTISSAKPEAIWKLWTDVNNWNRWDGGLESSRLDGAFVVGARGETVNKGAPSPLAFVLTEVKPLEGYTDQTELPGATVTFSHQLERAGDGVRITHRASIHGPEWQRYTAMFGANIEQGLPEAVQTLAELAEGR